MNVLLDKLFHPLEEIRLRSLDGLKLKLKASQIHIADIVHDRKCFKALLDCLDDDHSSTLQNKSMELLMMLIEHDSAKRTLRAIQGQQNFQKFIKYHHVNPEILSKINQFIEFAQNAPPSPTKSLPLSSPSNSLPSPSSPTASRSQAKKYSKQERENEEALSISQLHMEEDQEEKLQNEAYEAAITFLSTFPLMYKTILPSQSLIFKLEKFVSHLYDPEVSFEDEWELFCSIVRSSSALIALQYGPILISILNTLCLSHTDRQNQSLQYIEILVKEFLKNLNVLPIEAYCLPQRNIEERAKQPELFYLEGETRNIPLLEAFHMIFIQLIENLPYFASPEKALMILYLMVDHVHLLSYTLTTLLSFEYNISFFYAQKLIVAYPHLNEDTKILVLPFIMKYLHSLQEESSLKFSILKQAMYFISPELPGSYLMSIIQDSLNSNVTFELIYQLFSVDNPIVDLILDTNVDKLNEKAEADLFFVLMYLHALTQEGSESAKKVLLKILPSISKSKLQGNILYLVLSAMDYDDCNSLHVVQAEREGTIAEWTLCLFHQNMRVVQYGFQNLVKRGVIVSKDFETIISHVICKLEQETYELIVSTEEVKVLPFHKVVEEMVEGYKTAQDIYILLDSLLSHVLDESNKTLVEYLDVILSFLVTCLEKDRITYRSSILKVIEVFMALFKRFDNFKDKLDVDVHLSSVIQHISLVDERLNQAIFTHVYSITFSLFNPHHIEAHGWCFISNVFSYQPFVTVLESITEHFKPQVLEQASKLLSKIASVSHLSLDAQLVQESFDRIGSHEEFLDWINLVENSFFDALDAEFLMKLVPANKFSKFLNTRPLSIEDAQVFGALANYLSKIIEKVNLTPEYLQMIAKTIQSNNLTTILAHEELHLCHPATIAFLHMYTRRYRIDSGFSSKLSTSLCSFIDKLGASATEEAMAVKSLDLLRIFSVNNVEGIKQLCNLLLHRDNNTIRHLVAQVLSTSILSHPNLDLSPLIPYLTTFHEEDLFDLVLVIYHRGREHLLEKHVGSMIQFVDMNLNHPHVLGLIYALCQHRGYEHTIKLFGGFDWIREKILLVENKNTEQIILALEMLAECLSQGESMDKLIFEWLSQLYKEPLSFVTLFAEEENSPFDNYLLKQFSHVQKNNKEIIRCLVLRLLFKLVQGDDAYVEGASQTIFLDTSIIVNGDVTIKKLFLDLTSLLISRCGHSIEQTVISALNGKIKDTCAILDHVIQSLKSLEEFVHVLYLILSFDSINCPDALFANTNLLNLVWDQWHTSHERIYLSCLLYMLQHDEAKNWMIESKLIMKSIFKVLSDSQNEVRTIDYLNILRSFASKSSRCKVSLSKNNQLMELLFKKKDRHETLELFHTIFVSCPDSRNVFWDTIKKTKRSHVLQLWLQWLLDGLHLGAIVLRIIKVLILNDTGRYMVWKSGQLSNLQISFRQTIQQKKWDKCLYFIRFYISYAKSAFSSVYLLKERDFLDDILTCDARFNHEHKPEAIKLLTRLSQVPEHKSVLMSNENFVTSLLSWLQNQDKKTKHASLCLIYELIKDSEKMKVLLKQNGVDTCLKYQLNTLVHANKGKQSILVDNEKSMNEPISLVKNIDRMDNAFVSRCQTLLGLF